MERISSGTMHHGKNIKRLREILGVKQETIALGLNISQQAMSKLEQKDPIDKVIELYERLIKIEQENNSQLEKYLSLSKN